MKLRVLICFIIASTVFVSVASSAHALETRNVAVSKVTETEAVLVVKTDTASDVTVDYGSSSGIYTTTKSSNGMTRHEIALDGLHAGMRVYYRVEIVDSADPGTVINLDETSFRAARAAADPFSFAVAGDNRPDSDTVVQPAVWGTIVSQMAGEGLDLAFSVGDVIYGLPDTHAQNVARYDGFFAPTLQLTAAVPLYVAAGNHEFVNYAVGKSAYEQELTLPENDGADAATDGELYYSFDHGDTHFVILSTELGGEEGMIVNDQKDWLESDLAANTKPWVAVFMHRPLFRGYHVADPWVDPANTAGQQNQQDIHELFVLNDVDIVFAGHEHHYYHHVEDGIHYVITGGGGAPLSTPLPMDEGDVFAAADYHHVKVDETGHLMTVAVIDDEGAVIESFVLGGPELSLSLDNSYWASYVDYYQRNLSTDFDMVNTGKGDAINVELVFLAATSGVGPLTSVPVSVGDIVSGGSAGLSLSFSVPQGVSVFTAISYATCEDVEGNLYELPDPAPS